MELLSSFFILFLASGLAEQTKKVHPYYPEEE